MQTWFVKGTYILDGATFAQETIANSYMRKESGLVLLKLDFAKAYDMLDYKFI